MKTKVLIIACLISFSGLLSCQTKSKKVQQDGRDSTKIKDAIRLEQSVKSDSSELPKMSNDKELNSFICNFFQLLKEPNVQGKLLRDRQKK